MMKRLLAAIFAVLLTAGFVSLAAPTASAAISDVFDSFDVVAVVDEQGYVNVTETIVLRFGESSGRHGLERTLITREADDNDHDVVYKIDKVEVSSTDPVSTDLDLSEQGSGRNTYLRIRVGSSSRTIDAETATYTLTYRVQGLLRSQASYDELYWDVTGSSMPYIRSATATVKVPGGAKDVFCSVAAPGQRGDCVKAELAADGRGQFAAGPIPTGQLMSIGVQIGSGLIANNTPIRVENADTAAGRTAAVGLGVSLSLALLVPFFGWWYLRRKLADYRFAGVPPGVIPPRGQETPEVPDKPKLEIPVAFSPPRIGVAEAGLLIDGQTQVRDTTASLVALAVAGAVQLRSDEEQQVRLVDRGRAPDPISADLLEALFGSSAEPGAVVELGEPGTLTDAHERVGELSLATARSNGWFVREPGGSAGAGFNLVGVLAPLAVFGFAIMSSVTLTMLLFFVPLGLSVIATLAVVNAKLRRGQRTGMGRALTDQIEGFRLYLSTAEADQLKFEEGEDIFSKYLPWAIMFDLTERWTKVCERLVELGRLPDTAPYWYYGNYWNLHTIGWQLNSLDASVGAAIAAPAPSTADTGFGSGGSAFGGGGFSGGGGGGGGGGSW